MAITWGSSIWRTNFRLEDKAWNQISLVFDKTTYEMDLYYFDSNGMAGRYYLQLSEDVLPNDGFLGVGRWQPSPHVNDMQHGAEIFKGCIDQLRFWNRSNIIALSVCLSVCLSVSRSLSVCLSVCLSLSICLSVCLPVSVSLSLSICLSVCLSVCLPVSVSLSLSVCLPVSVSLSLSIYLSVCLSVSVFLSLSLTLSLSLCLVSLSLSLFRVMDSVILSAFL